MIRISDKIRAAGLILSVLLCTFIFAGCGGAETPDTSPVEESEALCFALSPADYIDGYNKLGRRGEDGAMRPFSGWVSLTEEAADSPFSGWSVRRFKKDESCWSDPAVMIYPSEDGKHVRAITFDLDDHAYTDYSFAEFRKSCLRSMRLLTGISGDKADALFEALYLQAAEGKGWYPDSSGEVPRVIYCGGNVGFYPYFRNGCMLRICAVPVTEEYLSQLEAKGADIYDLELMLISD